MKQNARTYLILVLVLSNWMLSANENPEWGRQDNLDYIEKFKDIAIREMYRTSIPASIKLAQGILKSAAGKSELARKGNNHFGIKCGGDWKGETLKKKDDDFKNGRRIKSCFRVYKNPEESFIDHSKFLTNPSKKSRYGFLFEYDKTDYVKWAKGLKKAGYATNPKYPQLLINLIEEYELHQFDLMDLDQLDGGEIAQNEEENEEELPPAILVEPVERPQKDKKQTKTSKKSQSKTKKKSKPTSEYGIFYRNDVKVILVHKDDTPQKIAKRYKIKTSKLIKYNELTPPYTLEEGSYVYLQPKRNTNRGKEKFHRVKNGETMHFISQYYGVKLKKLRKRNKMDLRQEPEVGEKIMLRGRRRTPPKLARGSKNNKEKKQANKQEDQKTKKEETSPKQSNPVTKQEDRNKDRIHTVKKGDTLYRIAKEYKVSVENLKKWNQLKNNNLEIGQELIIK